MLHRNGVQFEEKGGRHPGRFKSFQFSDSFPAGDSYIKHFGRVTSFDDGHSEQSNLLNTQFITWSISVECIRYLSLLPETQKVEEEERHLSKMKSRYSSNDWGPSRIFVSYLFDFKQVKELIMVITIC